MGIAVFHSQNVFDLEIRSNCIYVNTKGECKIEHQYAKPKPRGSPMSGCVYWEPPEYITKLIIGPKVWHSFFFFFWFFQFF